MLPLVVGGRFKYHLGYGLPENIFGSIKVYMPHLFTVALKNSLGVPYLYPKIEKTPL